MTEPAGESVRGATEREELERYRTIFETVDDAVYATDENRQFTWLNSAVERLTGYDRETLIGEHLFAFLDDEQIEQATQNLEYLLDPETPDVVTFEMEVRRSDGSTFPAETRTTLRPGGGFSGTVGIIRDVSDRKERELDLQQKNERLEAFADTISHDLRNPLNVAISRVELAMEESPSEHLDIAQRSLHRMDDLIGDLLALARQGDRIDDTEPVPLASLARSSWDIVATGDAELSVSGDATIEADRHRLRQLLENLLTNAVEHASAPVSVEVGALDDPAGFYVEDDGPGIAAENRDRVFEAGFTTDDDGTGFGLNIVEVIADAHGWTVSVEEGSEGGARFEFHDVVLV